MAQYKKNRKSLSFLKTYCSVSTT